MTIVSPSLLSLDFANTKEQLEQLNESRAPWLHYDVMDGHFVPNITFGPDLLRSIKKHTDKAIDVHIMVSNPLDVIEYFKDSGIYNMTFHYEAVDDHTMIPAIKRCRRYGMKASISIKPGTRPEELEGILDQIDMVLVMSVEPGFGGQSFMENSLEKLDWLHAYRVEHGFDYLLQIDGGINEETGRLAVQHHCDSLVAGSFVFKHPEGIVRAVDILTDL